MEVAPCAFPVKSNEDPHGNNALPSNSVFKCGTLDQSKGRDLPIFKPLNMKTEPKEITFKSVNLAEKLNLSYSVCSLVVPMLEEAILTSVLKKNFK